MRLSRIFALPLAAILLAACNKSSPPPQEPVKPRGFVQIEMPVSVPAP
ncbi:MAG TPA: hypothetical protein VLC74_10680 [Rhizomicrobium sp.]|nr:hypothetical protein [Rhizomicrobium sp.]